MIIITTKWLNKKWHFYHFADRFETRLINNYNNHNNNNKLDLKNKNISNSNR